MKKLYCPYCGEPISNRCDCERILEEEQRILEEEHLQLIEDCENDPETQYGWYQQDLIDMRRREWQ